MFIENVGEGEIISGIFLFILGYFIVLVWVLVGMVVIV